MPAELFKGQNFIDGQWRDGAVPFETVNPSDLDETVGAYTKVGEAEVAEAMDAARRALPAWYRLRWKAAPRRWSPRGASLPSAAAAP